MDSPTIILILGLPLVAALVTILFGRRPRSVALAGALTAAVLLVLVNLAGRQGQPPTLDIAGRALTMGSDVRGILGFFFVGLLLISLLASLWPGPRALIPGALGASSFLAASLMIDSFSFGAVFVLTAIASVVPVLVAGRFEAARVTWRAFLLAALAVVLLVLAGWLATSGQAGTQTAWLALLGAALLLMAGFPFHLWAGPLAREARPLAAALVLGLVYGVAAFVVLDLAAQIPAARTAPAFASLVRGSAAATALLGAFLMTRATSWTGAAAYALLIDMGCLVLALLLPPDIARQTVAAGLSARLLGLLLIAIARLWDGPPRWRVVAFLAGTLTLVGLPLTPGFPARWTELSAAGGSTGFPLALIAVVTALALGAAAALRAALRLGDDTVSTGLDTRGGRVAAGLLLLLWFLLGVIPQLLIEYASRVAGF